MGLEWVSPDTAVRLLQSLMLAQRAAAAGGSGAVGQSVCAGARGVGQKQLGSMHLLCRRPRPVLLHKRLGVGGIRSCEEEVGG